MNRLRFLLLGFILLLTACGEKLWLIKPFDVSKDDQVFMANVLIEKRARYQLALLFVQADTRRGREEQDKIFGTGGVPTPSHASDPEVLREISGVEIPLYVRLVKDGELLMDEELNTSAVDFYQWINYEGQDKHVTGRAAQVIWLDPGNYFLEARTVQETRE
ncbi:DUF5625 family protein, partial [Pseudomonas resinovorans]